MTQSSSPTALITGASRGLGLALASALAQRDWNLIINARDEAALDGAKRALSTHGTQIITVPGTIEDSHTHVSLHQAITVMGGTLDLLINNASTLGPSPQPPIIATNIEALATIFGVNTFAPMALIQTVASTFQDHPIILNISSDAGREAYPGWGGYGASKAALDHMSRTLAQEHPSWRVLSVDPGDMNTKMHQEAFPGEDISDRPEPSTRVPGLIHLIEGDHPSGLYSAGDFL